MSLYRLELEIPSVPNIAHWQQRAHWTVHSAEAARWREILRILVGRKRPPQPLQRAEIWLTRCCERECDWEQLVMGFKPVVDALMKSTAKVARADVIEDDRSSVLPGCRRHYAWEQAKRNRTRTKLVVEEVTE